MFRINVRLAFRSILQNKGLNSINMAGLAIGMMAVLLIYQYISFEKSYDKQLDNSDRLQRLVFYRYYQTGLDKSVGNNYYVGQIAHEKIPGIENFCRCRKETQYFQTGEKIFKEENTFFADSSFFDLFSFSVVSGVKKDFLRTPDVAIITESVAQKYFGNENPIGKTIYGMNPGKKALLVQGVVKDVPNNSHLKFDIVVSLSTLTGKSYCYSCNNTNTYFLLRKGANSAEIAKKITSLAQADFKARDVKLTFPIEYHLQPVTDIHLHSNYRFEHGINGNNKNLSILLVIAFFILISAGLNYFNFHSSIAIKRMKGIGSKIINGASRSDIVSEFAVEAWLAGLISLFLAVVLLNLLFPAFKKYLNLDFMLAPLSQVSSWLLPSLVLLFACLLTGILMGVRIFKRCPSAILKKDTRLVSRKNSRQFLLTTQFVIAIFLIAGTIGVMKQINYMQQEALTMNIGQTLVVKIPNLKEYNSSQKTFRETLHSLPEIAEVTYSTVIPGEKNGWVKGGIGLKGKEKLDDQVYQSNVAPNFFQFFHIKLLAGRQFFNDETNWNGGARHCIINKEAALAFGESNFKNIIGKTLLDNDNKEELGEIIGVVDGYFQNSLDQEVKPTVFNVDQGGYYIFLKLRGTNYQGIISKVTTEYNKYFQGQYFEHFFMDDFFNAQYKSHIQFNRCFILFSAMAILIASLSLFGLVLMISVARTKEIGIRKVNGARVTEILTMLNQDFIKWVAIAFVIACPVAWYAMHQWLQNFAYKTELSWWVFAAAGIVAVAVAIITVSWQSWRAATRNPVESLKYE